MFRVRLSNLPDILIETGIAAILLLAIVSLPDISYRKTMILFVFFGCFALDYLRFGTRTTTLLLLVLSVVGIAVITFFTLANLPLPQNALIEKLLKHFSRPPFQIWFATIVLLALRMVASKLKYSHDSRLSIEGVMMTLSSVMLYDLSRSVDLTLRGFAHEFTLPVATLFLFVAVSALAVRLIIGNDLRWCQAELLRALLVAFAGLSSLLAVLFLVLSTTYTLDLEPQKQTIQSILGILLVAVAFNACSGTSKGKRSRLKLIMTIVIGIIIVWSWIFEMNIFERFPQHFKNIWRLPS